MPDAPNSILIIMPTWLGDVVMATPTLRALQAHYPHAQITLAFKNPMSALSPCLPVNATTARWDQVKLSTLRADLAVLLPNSFRTAWATWRTGSRRRVGYARDGRGPLLTDRLLPPRQRNVFLPIPTVDYYLALADYLGADIQDATLQLNIPEPAAEQADALLQKVGLTERFVLLNPGAVRESKRWPAERFAALADQLHQSHRLQVAVTGSPSERAVLDAVIAQAQTPIADLSAAGLQLADLPAVVSRAALLITNDTGPRHVAAGVQTPVVTLFGPTPPEWTVIDYALERQLVAGGDTTPDEPRASAKQAVQGRTMDLIPVDDVKAACTELLEADA